MGLQEDCVSRRGNKYGVRRAVAENSPVERGRERGQGQAQGQSQSQTGEEVSRREEVRPGKVRRKGNKKNEGLGPRR